MNKFARYVREHKARAVAAAAVIGAPAFATGPDFSTLTAAVDFSTVATGVLALAALMVVPKVAAWGARKVIGFIRG